MKISQERGIELRLKCATRLFENILLQLEAVFSTLVIAIILTVNSKDPKSVIQEAFGFTWLFKHGHATETGLDAPERYYFVTGRVCKE